MKKYIYQHCQNHNFDIRINRNSRFTDQKVIPDVLSAVCECVIEYLGNEKHKEFTKNDIWHSEYANELITSSFNKPNLKNAKSEYDKFFAQPLKALSYAKVLKEEKKGTTNYYTVIDFEILKYISLRERNALFFLDIYLTKVLKDSGIYQSFSTFFENQDKASLNLLRKDLFTFYYSNTSIKEKYEPPRIFNKIINILAFKQNLKGTASGTVSKFSLTIDEIRYNRVNWRDIGKDKQTTREMFYKNLSENEENKGFFNYSIQKAKKFVKQIHRYSEIHRFDNYLALQAHHIFPQNEFPEIADLPENIIAITPNQHFYRAHPNNKTTVIDTNYQMICLMSKLDSIEINYRADNDDYNFDDFVKVLNTGYNTDFFKRTMEFEEVKHQIVNNYFEMKK